MVARQLVSSSIHLLTTVAKNVNQRELFGNPETMKAICERIIVPNLQLRGTPVAATGGVQSTH